MKIIKLVDELDESVDIIFELTNFNKEIKFNILNLLTQNSNAALISSLA